MFSLYTIITNLCLERGISGGKMCTDIGVSRAFMTELKMGRKKSVNITTAKKLADYFNVPIDTFVESEISPEEAPWESVDDFRNYMKEEQKVLFDLTDDVSKEDMVKIIKMIKAFKGEE